MKKVLFGILFLTIMSGTQAQQITKRLCGQDILMQSLEKKYPGYKKAVENSFNQAEAHKSARSGGIYTIPVVVHVVWKNVEENIDDSVIHSQIDVLNEDYRRLNPDAVNTRPIFDTVAGDAMIQFHLKQIIRVQTTNEFDAGTGGLPDSLVKLTANGGSDAVDPEYNLNIWMIDINPIMIGGFELGKLLGYSYPPAGLSNWPAGQEAPQTGYDGVVVDFRSVGRNNPNPLTVSGVAQVVRGRTCSHEIGHYLGLRHIWGDGGSGFGGGNDCNQSDGIDDTPYAADQSQFDCDFTANTCTRVETYYNADVPNMVENYMDYSAETCMNMFSKGQVAHMRAVLQDQRQNLPELNTAVTDVANTNLFSVYPNPATGLVFVKMTSTTNDFKVEVKNMLGENINSISYTGNNTAKIDLSAYANGVYIIEVLSNGNRMNKKVVLSR